MINFERGKGLKDAMGIGQKQVVKNWLDKHNVNYVDVRNENEDTDDFKVVVYIEASSVFIDFEQEDSFTVPAKVEFRRK